MTRRRTARRGRRVVQPLGLRYRALFF